ncbi:hypothetical protein TrRE_jg8608 [Triparma retinervis]|uniref:Histone deacetylase domain-containing protein n=1 Tax=Triparma retinervis TaxID=2557542 RepID=A0A9W7FF73_9STRA|nr:hypothetical protein TrRE_jg8608 [Triparma retinervis]
MSTKKRVSYFYDAEIGNYHYGQGHPMKPHRVRMTHNLVVNYGLYRNLEVFRPRLVSHTNLTRFHSDDYVNFLRTITPDNMGDFARQLARFNVGEDCPVFDGLFEFCQLYTSGSIGGAARLNENLSDVAFYTTNRVMTVSFHKFGEYFPGTGDVLDKGYDRGVGYSINFPLHDGMDDASFRDIFRPVIGAVMTRFSPGAIVLQCGADSLSGDRLGCFNLSLKGHADCVEFVKSFDVPLLVLGGGGYTLRNVPRCWTYETAVLLEAEIKDCLPYNDYYEYFGPDYRLHMPTSNMENLNTPQYLDRTRVQLLEILGGLEAVPGAQIVTGQVGGGNPRGMDIEDVGGTDDGGKGDDVKEDASDKKEHQSELAA